MKPALVWLFYIWMMVSAAGILCATAAGLTERISDRSNYLESLTK